MELERGYAVVKIYAGQVAIVGKILLVEREFYRGRLSDYLNRPDVEFIPVHEASVFSLKTKKPMGGKTFLLLNKRSIDWLIPVKEPTMVGDELGTEVEMLESFEEFLE